MSSTPLPRAPRERPQPVENRGSMLRASIFESALELGVGSSGSTVAKWMFSPIEEGNEDIDAESATSPSLTYASTATSEDSFLSTSLSPRSQPGAGILLTQSKPLKPTGLVPSSTYASREGLSPISEGTQRIQFDLSASPEPRVVSPVPPTGLGSRLRRLRLNTNTNGDESDGGYISDAGKGKKEKKKKIKKVKDDGNGTEYESDGGYFSEASRMQRKKTKKDKKAAKEKEAESPTTDYETDGGGVGRAKTKKTRSRKASTMSPGTGDESDGGNISESAKKKGFFRLNSRSRKKRDADSSPAQEVPPVPALPSMSHPIANRFLRSPTPNMSELSRTMSDTSRTISELSRTTTETERTATPVTSSVNTADEASLISYATTELDAGSIIARDGLTKAFGDAKSIHRPSYDMLATFRNPSPMRPGSNQSEDTQSPLSPSSHPFARTYDSPNRPPGSSPSKSKNAKPVISAPNTAMLSAKHIPAPLVLNSPASIHSQTAQQYQLTPGSDYVMVTPQATPISHQAMQQPTAPSSAESVRPDSELLLPSPSRRGFTDNGPPSPKAGQSSLRPQVAAYYNIPPPTPPPQGPLPDVPPDSSRLPHPASPELSRAASADDMRVRSPLVRAPLSATRTNPPARALPLTPMSAPMHPARSASESDARSPSPPGAALSVPVISEPVPRTQRGRISPFPTSPVQPTRALSPLLSRSASPAPMTPPLSANAAVSPRAERLARYIGNKPGSADGYVPAGGRRDPGRLDVRWAPRSNSALEQRRPDAFDALPVRKKVSFEDERPSVDGPEDEDIYAGERSELHMGDDSDMEDDVEPVASGDQSSYPEDDDRSHYEDSRPGTVYSEADDRDSMWSQSDGRRSFFDEDKSADARKRFVKQVEKMYGEYKVPPVPTLSPQQLNRGVVG